jgi:tripartite-type tricarboxylate transporter receptor subunit TctC
MISLGTWVGFLRGVSSCIASVASRSAVVAAAILGLAPSLAEAETYPSRPVTIIVPFTAGSATDAAARIISHHLAEALGQRFVIENKPGAGGTIAAAGVARAAPDGYTLFITTNTTHSAAPALFKNVSYDPVKDFTAVTRMGSFPSMLVANPDMPFKTVQELVAYAKANPGKLEYAHGNSTGHIAGETLKRQAGIELVRVPYRSNPSAVTDLISGRMPLMITDFTTGLPQVRAGKMRPLAVLTKEHSAILPEVPTLHETVAPEFDLLAWVGMFGPADMPKEVTERLASEVQKIVTNPALQERFLESGIETGWMGPDKFKDYVKTELVKWTKAIKEAGIQPE